MMTRQLEGKAAWISGAASGIGAATARLFAAEGANVALVDIQADLVRETAESIVTAGGAALPIACDVAQESEVARSVTRTVEAFGALHIVVNCAGIAHFKPLHEFTEQEWDRIMSVNLKSQFFAIKHALPHLRGHQRSYVVNIGSISCFIGDQNESAYSASKGGVLMLTKSVALEYAADGLRCNCICPGITDTPMLRYHLGLTGDPEATLAARLRRTPTGVAVQPEDVAKVALFLSSEASSGITGTHLLVDGGLLAAAEWLSPPRTAFMNC
jgi:NAD(P)-dependent dehydrogenase (short-subunit alcohol dehydrogenase family)